MVDGTDELRHAFDRVGAHEGTVWLLDEEQRSLVPAWNSGPNAGEFVGHYRQPLERGLISLVCISGQSLCENNVYTNARQDPSLDRALGKLTCAMLAVPLRKGGEIRGVLSCVKLKGREEAGPDPAGFGPEDLHAMDEVAEAAGEALELPV